MKKHLFLLILVACILGACEPYIITSDTTHSESRDTIRMGYRSVVSYQYMRYTGDSALVKVVVTERDSATCHYTHAELSAGEESLIVSDSLPIEVEFPIPIMDDSTIVIRHLCWVDTLDSVMYKEPLLYELNVHKGEIVNQNPDTANSYLYDILLITHLTVH